MSERERIALNTLFSKYLYQSGVTDYRPYRNRFSKIDGVFFSGGTDACFEFKERINTKIEDYSSTILEKDKYEALMSEANNIAGVAFYIVQYDNAILIFNLSAMPIPIFREWYLPNSYGGESKHKMVAELPYGDAAYTISTKHGTYTRKENSELQDYIQRIRTIIKERNERFKAII